MWCLKALSLNLVFVLLFACSSAPNYTYVSQKGRITQAPHPIPKGNISIASPETTDYKAGLKPSVTVPALRLRLTLANQSSDRWVFNFKDQVLHFTGHNSATSLNVEKAEVLQGETQVVDLYFALPAGVKTAADLSGFELDWKIVLPNRNQFIAGVAPYERVIAREEFARLHPEASVYDLPTYDHYFGPSYEQAQGLSQNFSVWTFETSSEPNASNQVAPPPKSTG
ncbi:MAG: hypothetical protein P4M08_03815 [Oligoflexia bacterium]|nr:hypothetical protein [Oligoflexia bacterium]